MVTTTSEAANVTTEQVHDAQCQRQTQTVAFDWTSSGVAVKKVESEKVTGPLVSGKWGKLYAERRGSDRLGGTRLRDGHSAKIPGMEDPTYALSIRFEKILFQVFRRSGAGA